MGRATPASTDPASPLAGGCDTSLSVPRLAGPLLCLASSAWAIAGCGESTLPTSVAERDAVVGAHRLTQVAGLRARCPDKITTRIGDTFRCRVTARDGTNASGHGRFMDDDGTYTIFFSLVHTREVEPQLARDFFDGQATVRCPDLMELRERHSWTCHVIADDGRKWRVRGTVEDDKGKVDWRVLR